MQRTSLRVGFGLPVRLERDVAALGIADARAAITDRLATAGRM